MLWIIICVDKPGAAALRTEHLAAHRFYLASMSHRLFFSGPQMSDDGATQIGSVFMVHAASREDAQKFVEGEDLYRAGVFATVDIRRIRCGRLNPELADA
jgi:uncharacterized protein YciI